jgi:hypothetical protein
MRDRWCMERERITAGGWWMEEEEEGEGGGGEEEEEQEAFWGPNKKQGLILHACL